MEDVGGTAGLHSAGLRDGTLTDESVGVTRGVLRRGDVSLHYEVHGSPSSRTPVLLTHGFGSSSGMWGPNLEAIARDRTVITWDIRGHGRTRTPGSAGLYSAALAVEDMTEILDECGVGEAVVGGLSLGGYLSLAFHLSHRERVRALMLFDTGPGFRNDEGRQRWNAYAVSRAQAFEEQGLAAQSDSPETAYGPHDASGLARAARGILTQQDASVISSLGSIAVPTLVLVGENDRPFLAAADYMASHIPGATRVVISGAGHAANLDQPDQFSRAVEDFLSGV